MHTLCRKVDGEHRCASSWPVDHWSPVALSRVEIVTVDVGVELVTLSLTETPRHSNSSTTMSSFFGLWVHNKYQGHSWCWEWCYSGKTRTFKPRKDVPEGTKQYQLRKYAEATLVSDSHSWDRYHLYSLLACNQCDRRVQGSGNLRLAVQLPEGEDTNEWLAVHGKCVWVEFELHIWWLCHAAVDFFNHLNMLYGTVTEFCTPQEVCMMCTWISNGNLTKISILSVPNYVCWSEVSNVDPQLWRCVTKFW